MIAAFRKLLYGLPLSAWPAVAAVPGDDTGITSVAPAMFIFAVAAALLLTLVFRASARHAARVISQKLAGARIRRALHARSSDVLHDFILPGAYGGLARIDHAVMTAGGILCIRAISMNGVVFGGADEAQWTNVDGVKRRRFLNPLIQNEGRARAIRNVVPNVPVENLVIFSGNVEFSSPPPANVIRLSELESFVAKFVFGPSRIDDWNAVWLNLKSAVLDDNDSRKDLAAQIGFS
ncbi:MAG: nuclease-related domain-containing protein [Woeseiaceae bacterium]|nr:nuclease-related domain-containing protein [Woeseiaceae bacterium]